VRTTNGLDVPKGWATRPTPPLRPCPVCGQAVETYVSPAKVRLFRRHLRIPAKVPCPGSYREVKR
jgi:hypothetical protein